jgi:Cu/Zn superoxide dismutase
MRKIAYLTLPVIGLMIVACESRKAENTAETPPAETPATTPAPAPTPEAAPTPLVTAAVTGKGTGSKIQGQVQVLPSTDPATSFKVSVDLTGVPEGMHDWHIHQGSCAANGPVVVPFTADKDKQGISSPIQAPADGIVKVEADVPSSMLTADQLKSGEYSLHVHAKSDAKNHGPTIACSDLKS